MDIRIAGETALILYFGEGISPVQLARVQRAVALIDGDKTLPVVDMIPSYSSLVVVYDPGRINYRTLRQRLRALLANSAGSEKKSGKTLTLPVYYSLESGPDLHAMAASRNLTPEDIIGLHSAREYLVYAIGFAPGFAYLGEVDSALATPRRATPRLSVPRGSVAIADTQTAVYPATSPGGWNLIGLCPTPLFDPAAKEPMPVAVGDRVRFKPVSKREFLRLGGSL